jgi:DNA-binding transcriptional MocR family regulator
MAIQLARRMEGLKASDVREILKITQNSEVISFAGGLPAPELFPVKDLGEATRKVLEEDGQKALQYSTTEGYMPLREMLARRMNARCGIRATADEVLITTGSQQALDLTGKLLLDEGDTVLCESPTYVGAISALNVFSPRWVEIPTDDGGMDVDALQRRLENCDRIKLIYVVPNFQNPTGITWSLERRRRFAEVVMRHSVAVVEDNPYGELRFEGIPLPPIKSFDTKGHVIYLGTFSKILSPGMRIGWLTAAQPLYDKYVILKQGGDLHTSTLSQMQIAAYLESFDIDQHLARMRALYRERRDAMIRSLEKEMPRCVSFSRPAGGLFLWVELPAHLDARELLRRSLELQVAFVPGGSFFPKGNKENTLRLSYSNMPVSRIEEGIRRLARAVKEMLSAGAHNGRLDAGGGGTFSTRAQA